jgi:hypothetical protein
MTIGQNSVVRWSRCRNSEADENYSDQQVEGTRSASGGRSATKNVSATKRRSKRLDAQAKEEIHASEEIEAARASEVSCEALARGPWRRAQIKQRLADTGGGRTQIEVTRVKS